MFPQNCEEEGEYPAFAWLTGPWLSSEEGWLRPDPISTYEGYGYMRTAISDEDDYWSHRMSSPSETGMH